MDGTTSNQIVDKTYNNNEEQNGILGSNSDDSEDEDEDQEIVNSSSYILNATDQSSYMIVDDSYIG